VNLDALEPWSEAHTRAQRALVERLCAELGIDEAELIRRAGKMFREHARRLWQERQEGKEDTWPHTPQN
jgi:NAD(P)H-hydrate repair Nnr-like enzyme with NAD(P)H-hydrate epimerase domain